MDNKKWLNLIGECRNCDCWDEDFGCTMSSIDKWCACSIESKKPENQQALKEWLEWMDKQG